MSDQSEVERECLPMCQLPLDHEGECDQSRFLERCKPSPGADHMQPVETHCPLCREPFEGSDWLAPNDHGVGQCINAAYYAARESTKSQPAPALREISDEECEDFVRQAWKRANQTDETQHYEFTHWHDAYVDKAEKAIARYALESRAPQTAPRDPYKRGQLLP